VSSCLHPLPLASVKKEWELGGKSLQVLQDEVTRLEGELKHAKGRQSSAEKQRRATIAKCNVEKEELRKTIDATEAELIAKKKKAKGYKEEVESKDREIGELRASLQASRNALEAARAAGKLRVEDGNRLHYVLASTGQAGSFPRSYFDSAPESLLCKMYNCEWDYARD
jgi:chromosome segregation ATPase